MYSLKIWCDYFSWATFCLRAEIKSCNIRWVGWDADPHLCLCKHTVTIMYRQRSDLGPTVLPAVDIVQVCVCVCVFTWKRGWAGVSRTSATTRTSPLTTEEEHGGVEKKGSPQTGDTHTLVEILCNGRFFFFSLPFWCHFLEADV